MKQKTFYKIGSYLTLAGSMLNFYDAGHNLLLNHITQRILDNIKYGGILREISTINNPNLVNWSDYLSKSIQRTSFFEFGSSILLLGISYYFHRKFKQCKKSSIDNLVLDID